jgi:D-serine deaminase-like pyridoxal phosphate-dependent protein
VTELHPGNYIFYDAMQVQIGSCRESDVAASVLGTVVGVYPERESALIDVGSRALGKDALEKPSASPWGIVAGRADVALVRISQEVGILRGSGVATLTVGQQLRILPNHSCLAATNFSEYHVIQGDSVVGTIRPLDRSFC